MTCIIVFYLGAAILKWNDDYLNKEIVIFKIQYNYACLNLLNLQRYLRNSEVL